MRRICRLKPNESRQAYVISTPTSEKSIHIFKPAFSPHFQTGANVIHHALI